MELDRRNFLRLALAAVIAEHGAAGCRRQESPPAPLPPGTPLDTLKVRGYRGLAELPYFEIAPDGRLRLTVDGLASGVDFHTHLAVNMFLAPGVDLLRRTPETRYMIDCDASEPPCVFDLDVYMNRIATPAMLDHMESEVLGMIFLGSNIAKTHTIPNLLAEMDAARVRQAALLAIAPGFPFRDNLTQRWYDAVQRSGTRDRFVLFGSVHPTSRGACDRLRQLHHQLSLGGVKLHPTMQRFNPDAPAAMELYQTCAELHLPVFFHAGRAGIEPEFTRDHARMQHYVAPVAEFPQVPFVFGHAGARDYRDAIPIATANRNVWMEIAGQGVSALRQLLAELGPERLLFGTDWPWYPVAATLAKLLIVTEDDTTARNLIFADNARRLLAGHLPV